MSPLGVVLLPLFMTESPFRPETIAGNHAAMTASEAPTVAAAPAPPTPAPAPPPTRAALIERGPRRAGASRARAASSAESERAGHPDGDESEEDEPSGDHGAERERATREIAGAVTKSSRAAAVTEPVSETARRARNCLSVTPRIEGSFQKN